MKMTAISPEQHAALVANTPAALAPLGLGELGHCKTLDLVARQLGFRNHEQFQGRRAQSPVTVRITVECIVKDQFRHQDDVRDLRLGEHFVDLDAPGDDPCEDALDRFSETVPIADPGHYDIQAEVVELDAWVVVVREPIMDQMDYMVVRAETSTEACKKVDAITHKRVNEDDEAPLYEVWTAMRLADLNEAAKMPVNA